jgi:drug/metabolite transporter (DMT)-like permease
MSTTVALLVLFSALMHAIWNYLVKASPDGLLDTVGLAVGGSLIAACLLPFVPFPAEECWPWLGITIFIHIGYFLALVAAYRHADLSVAYPIMRGSAPVLVALATPLTGDVLSPGTLAGVFLVAVGITLPAWLGMHRGAVAKTGVWFACGNAVLIASYTLIDGMGVRLSGSAVSYTLWLFFLDAWGILAIALWQRGFSVIGHLRQRWKLALSGSVLALGSYGIVLWAMTIAPIPAIAALRESSVIFAALLGAILLKERMGRWRIAGSVLVAFGAAAIRWG